MLGGWGMGTLGRAQGRRREQAGTAPADPFSTSLITVTPQGPACSPDISALLGTEPTAAFPPPRRRVETQAQEGGARPREPRGSWQVEASRVRLGRSRELRSQSRLLRSPVVAGGTGQGQRLVLNSKSWKRDAPEGGPSPFCFSGPWPPGPPPGGLGLVSPRRHGRHPCAPLPVRPGERPHLTRLGDGEVWNWWRHNVANALQPLGCVLRP